MAPHYTKAVLLYNPEAGRNRKLRPQQIEMARAELERAGISVTPQATTGAGSGSALARDAIHAGADLIVVCGGDGTINEVVGGMAHSRVPLGILPGGTANVLARELGLPLDIHAAARSLVSATPRRLALGVAEGRYFLLMAGVGFDAQVLYQFRGRWKKLLGMGGYVVEALRQVLFRPPVPFLVSSDNQRLEATFACISKSQHYGPFRMVAEADLFSDRFYVYCFRSRDRFRYIEYALALIGGSLPQLADVSRFPARKVWCEELHPGEEKVFFQVDGELIGQLPCAIEIVPDALTLLAPGR